MTSCQKSRIVFSLVDSRDNNLKLDGHEIVVNGTPCDVLRDLATTMDIVHPCSMKAEDFTGERAWIRQVVDVMNGTKICRQRRRCGAGRE